MDPMRHASQRLVLETTENELQERMYRVVDALRTEVWVTPEPVPFADRTCGRHVVIRPGEVWGGLWDCGWFRFQGRVPADCAGKPVVLLLDVGGEGLVFDGEGQPVRGITTAGTSGAYTHGMMGKRVVWVAERALGGEEIDVWVDAGCNDLHGSLPSGGKLVRADLAMREDALRELYYDFSTLRDLLSAVPEKRNRHARALSALARAARVLHDYTETEVHRAQEILRPELEKRGGTPSFRVCAVGHAHIDLGWTWPVRETKRKGARTFATALALMDRYPDYVFGASQAQLYEWVRLQHPEMFDRIRRRVAEGRWEVQGGFWVECDVNMPSGESLARQALYGQRYFQEHFGAMPETCWIPDTFGYTAALPQIARLSGMTCIEAFKINWCELFRYPFTSFVWEGIDGSRLLAQTLTNENYSSWCTPSEIARCEENRKNDLGPDVGLLLFGLGDGGGGPGMEHLELLERVKDLEGVAPTEQIPASEFFRRLAESQDSLPVWKGPLDMDKHTGTLTSQAKGKMRNREIELALHRTEFLCTEALLAKDAVYPSAELERIWKEALLYQFHDILSGTCIQRVHDECEVWYVEALARLEGLSAAAMAAMAASEDALWNTLDVPVSTWTRTAAGWRRLEVPAFACRTLRTAEGSPLVGTAAADGSSLENDLVRLVFDESGRISSLLDKASGREFLAQPVNELAVYDDFLGLNKTWGIDNAWDFPVDYRERQVGSFVLESVEWGTDGPFAYRKQTFRYGTSVLVQTIRLEEGSAKVDLEFEVDWRERRRMLRTRFPLAFRTTELLRGIQFGHVDEAACDREFQKIRQDSPVHGWVDASDGSIGLALLNRYKYGVSLRDGAIDLCLLRSPTSPAPLADFGHHAFSYALLPHVGGALEAGVPDAARIDAQPPISAKGDDQDSPIRFVGEGIVLDTVKAGEDGGVVLRFYENRGKPASGRLRASPGLPREAFESDLLERIRRALPLEEGTWILEFKAFEIKTVLLR
jgi:alpha-mannosidase